MPDGSRHTKFQVLEIDIAPAKREQLADSKSGPGVEKSQRALSDGQLAEKKLQLRWFKNVGRSLSLRALTYELDWVAFNPLVPHCVMKDCAHDIPNLRSRALRPLDAVQPFFNSYRLDVIKSVIPPARKNPAIRIAFVPGARRERLASLVHQPAP
jgi:hypothetical protein